MQTIKMKQVEKQENIILIIINSTKPARAVALLQHHNHDKSSASIV